MDNMAEVKGLTTDHSGAINKNDPTPPQPPSHRNTETNPSVHSLKMKKTGVFIFQLMQSPLSWAASHVTCAGVYVALLGVKKRE